MRRLGLALSDLLLVVIGLVSIAVSVRSLFEPPKSIEQLGNILSALLGATGLLLVAAVIERRARLDTLFREFTDLRKAISPNAAYLSDRQAVERALAHLADSSSDHILAMGARSSAADYLTAVEDAVTRRSATYHRVVNGDYIFHPMHAHLTKVMKHENVFIAWTPHEKFGNIAVGDTECVVAFPSPYIDRFAGLRLMGEAVASQYGQQIMAAFAGCDPLTADMAEKLCVDCRAPVEVQHHPRA
jgi:hypothetical protein